MEHGRAPLSNTVTIVEMLSLGLAWNITELRKVVTKNAVHL